MVGVDCNRPEVHLGSILALALAREKKRKEEERIMSDGFKISSRR